MSVLFKAGHDVVIRTQDWEAAREFYRSVLGLSIKYESEGIVGFDAGEFCLYVEKGPQHGPVFEFLVDHLDTAKSSLLLAGCTVREQDASAARCYIQDPFGLVFNIRQSSEK